MLKNILFSISLMAIFVSPALAQDTCSKSKFKLLDNSIPFGTPEGKVEALVKKNFGRNAVVVKPRADLIAVAFTKPYKNFDRIIFLTRGGVVTRVLFGYAKSFTSSLGSATDVLKIMLPKLREKYGEHDDLNVDESESKATFVWAEDGGATLSFIIGDNTGPDLRFDCDALEREAHKKAKNNANFGF